MWHKLLALLLLALVTCFACRFPQAQAYPTAEDRLGEFLGRGTFGAVHKLPYDPQTVVKVSNFSWNDANALVNLREAIILNYLDHPNILKPQNVRWGNVAGKESLLLYLPYAESSRQVRIATPQLLKAASETLAYLHGLNMAHSDLKPIHFLKAKKRIVLVDYGSCDLDVTRPGHANKTTQHYRSPENLFGFFDYPRELDIWSLAISILENEGQDQVIPLLFDLNYKATELNDRMLYGVIKSFGIPPKHTAIFQQYLTKKSQLRLYEPDRKSYVIYPVKQYPWQNLGEKFPQLDPLLISLLEGMLEFDPRTRLNAAQILRHPYMNTYFKGENKQEKFLMNKAHHQQLSSLDREFFANEFAMLAALCDSLNLDDYIFFESASLFAQMVEIEGRESLTKPRLHLWENCALFLGLILYGEVNKALDLIGAQCDAALPASEVFEACERFLNASKFNVLYDHAFRLASRAGITIGPQAAKNIASLKEMLIRLGDVNIPFNL